MAALVVGGCGLLGSWLEWWAAEEAAAIIMFALACLRVADCMKTPAYLTEAAADLLPVLRLAQDIRQEVETIEREQRRATEPSDTAGDV